LQPKKLSVPSPFGYESQSTSRISNKKHMDQGDKGQWDAYRNREKNDSNAKFTRLHKEIINRSRRLRRLLCIEAGFKPVKRRLTCPFRGLNNVF
jgi:hypothetical protein